MRIIFIRHGEPDYEINGLTENGAREAIALAKRTKDWDIDRFYLSPMGRAIDTAAPTLKYHSDKEVITLDWLREYSYKVKDITTGREGVCWDRVPADWADEPLMYTKDQWLNIEPFVQNPELKEVYIEATNGIDKIVEQYGYKRTGNYYINTKNPKMRNISSTCTSPRTHFGNELDEGDTGPTIVFFCHFGIICLMLSHLIGLPFPVLAQNTIIPTTGVTIVNTEERWDDQVSFRIQTMGCVHHLLAEGLPVSSAGSFAHLFQK